MDFVEARRLQTLVQMKKHERREKEEEKSRLLASLETTISELYLETEELIKQRNSFLVKLLMDELMQNCIWSIENSHFTEDDSTIYFDIKFVSEAKLSKELEKLLIDSQIYELTYRKNSVEQIQLRKEGYGQVSLLWSGTFDILLSFSECLQLTGVRYKMIFEENALERFINDYLAVIDEDEKGVKLLKTELNVFQKIQKNSG